jgi:hypothetical protein
MRKKLTILLIGINAVIFSSNPVFSQLKNDYLGGSQSFTRDQCAEALNLFYEGYSKNMTIPSDIFDPMKLLVQRSSNQNESKLNKKSTEQLLILMGVKEGGPMSYGNGSEWRLGKSLSTESARFLLNFNEVVADFKQAMIAQAAPECAECQTLVNKYYQAYVSKFILPEAEFTALKLEVLRCKDQRREECGKKKMDEQLGILSGELEGGPMSYGDDAKWRLNSPPALRNQVSYVTGRTLSHGDVIVSNAGKLGVMDKSGYLFIPTKYDNITSYTYNNAPIYVVTLNSKLGIYGASGQQIIPFQYDYIVGFSYENNACLTFLKDGKWGIISNGLAQAITTNYEDISYRGSWISVRENGKTGFLNKDGSVAIVPKYDGVGAVFDSFFPSSEVLPVLLNGKFGLIDKDLKEIVSPTYDRVGYFGENKTKPVKSGFIPIYVNNKVGYINDLGTVLVEPKYDLINGFGLTGYGLDKVSYVKLADKWGLLDNSTGKEITLLKYDELFGFSEKYLSAGFKEGGKYGLISIDGTELLPAKYDAVYNFWDNDLAAIKLNGFLGLINTKGDVLIAPRYQSLDLLDNGVFISKLNNKAGLLNASGQELIAPKFDEILPIDNGFYPTRIGAKWGYLNEYGSEVVQPIFDAKVSFQDDIATVQANGVSYKINKSGQRVLNNFYNSSFKDLTIDGKTLYDITTSSMADIYQKALNKLMVGSMLGSASANAISAQITSQKKDLQNEIKDLLGGNMTASQQAEFTEIAKNEEANFNLTLSTIGSALRSSSSSNSGSKSSSGQGGYNTCQWCGARFTGLGYNFTDYGDYGGLKIFEGHSEDTVVLGILGAKNGPGCFHSKECAYKAFKAGQKSCD